MPVHCVVEGVPVVEALCGDGFPSHAFRRGGAPNVEADSYVIIPAATAFRELVSQALLRLGYPHDCAALARGMSLITIIRW